MIKTGACVLVFLHGSASSRASISIIAAIPGKAVTVNLPLSNYGRADVRMSCVLRTHTVVLAHTRGAVTGRLTPTRSLTEGKSSDTWDFTNAPILFSEWGEG